MTFAPREHTELDDDATLLLVRRRPRTRPPKWNPPLSLAEEDAALADTVRLDKPVSPC
jgi:hypothetical protein